MGRIRPRDGSRKRYDVARKFPAVCLTTYSPQDNVLVKAPHWPWESVRNKLREALTEMSVLSDVIAISTKEVGKDLNGQPKRYMVLDGPVQSGAERVSWKEMKKCDEKKK